MNFQVTEQNPFELVLRGSLDFQFTNDALTIILKIRDEKDPEGEPDGKGGITIPLDLFGPPPERMFYAVEFAERVKRNILRGTTLRGAIIQEIAFHLDDTIHLAANDLGHEQWTDDEIISSHLQKTAARLKQSLESDEKPIWPKRGRGQPRQWSKLRLTHAVSTALRELPKGMARDYENVNEILKRDYPDIAPASGESLRKLMKSLGVDWKGLKAESNSQPNGD